MLRAAISSRASDAYKGLIYMREIDGGITAVRGVEAWGVKEGKNGLAIILADGVPAGVFTRNKVTAAPIIVTRRHIANGRIAGVIANSGNANAYTGEQGVRDAEAMCALLAERMCQASEMIAVASTGVIGRSLNLDWIRDHVDRVYDSIDTTPEASERAARAIMTTDTTPKEVAVELGDGTRIAGIAKGSGMIEPNMGTMLAFLYTDASIPHDKLQRMLGGAVDQSFNMVVVDGDTSTNDTCLITATGLAGEPDTSEFEEGLDYVCQSLARMVARDGEGATRLIEVTVRGAKTPEDARRVAKAIVRSPLVKTAVYGEDPNWGRVIAAVGYSDADVNPDRITLEFSDGDETIGLVERGEITGRNDEAQEIMSADTVYINVDLGLGDAGAVAWGCDLTYDYVKINAEYTT